MSLEIYPEGGYELRSDEARHERCYWRRVGFFIFLGLVIGMLLGPLYGCSTEMRSEVCYLRLLGKTEQGYTVVAQACQSPEAFAASQR